MRTRVSVLGVPFLVFMAMLTFCVIAEAQGIGRDAVIAKELDCVAQNLSESKGLGWADVCYTKEGRDMYEADPVFVNADNPAAALSEGYDMDVHNAPYTTFEHESTAGNSFYRFFDFANPLNDIEFGTEAFFYTYEEPLFMDLEGYTWGLYAVYTHRTSLNEHFETWKDAFSSENAINVFRFDVRGSWGILDYDSNGTGSIEDANHYTFEVRGLIGEDIPVSDTFRVMPYIGIGYRYLLDDNGGGTTSTGALGYDRESQYFYIPTGIEVEKKLAGNWSLGINFEYDLFVDGQQKSHHEDYNPGYNTVSMDQNHGMGMRGSLKIMKQSERFDFYLESFVRYWSIDDSNSGERTLNGVFESWRYEPKNETSEIGIKVGANF